MNIKAKLLLISLAVTIALIGIILIILNQKDSAGYVVPSITSIQPDGLYYDVVYVYDGDTISVNMMGIKEKVRLIGVDTPETQDPDTPPQCYGQESSNYSKNNLNGKKVRLETDPTNQNRDRYNRLLRYVYTTDGKLWNKELISAGYGFAYLRFPFIKQSEFMDAEKQSSKLKLGLWSQCQVDVINGVYRTNTL